MLPFLVLSVSMLGQCSGGSCPSPSMFGGFDSFGGGMLAQPAFARPVAIPAPVAVQVAPAPMLQRYTIDHDGLVLQVEGWQFEKGGKVTWEPDRPFNAQALKAAREKKAGELAAKNRPAEPRRNYIDEKGTLVMFPKEGGHAEIGQVGAKPIMNYGLAPDKLGHSKSEYHAASDEAKRFVAEATQDAEAPGKLHVTIIGDESERKRVVNDIKTNAAFDGIREHLMIQAYAPGEWPVDPSLGFQPGKPSIVVQTAKGPGDPKGGRVVHRANDYAEGPEKLAQEIRKADPDYRPDRDPGPATGKGSGSCPLGFTRDHWPIILIVGAGLYVVFLKLPRKEG